MGRLDVSVIVVSYNTRELLLACLHSVLDTATDFAYEVIVSENGSQDGSEQGVRAQFPTVKVIQNRADLGFGAAVNVAAKVATGEYLAIVAPDAIMLPGTLTHLLELARSGDIPGVAACRLLGAHGQLQTSCARLPTPLRLMAVFTRLDKVLPFPPFQLYYDRIGYWGKRQWNHDRRRRVDTLLGAFLFIPAAVFHSVGGFDQRFFMYYEEVDLFTTLHARKCPVDFVSEVAMVHFGGEATKQEYARMRFEAQRSLLIYTAKWHGLVAAQLVRLMLIALALLRLARFGLSRSASQDLRDAARVILGGLIRLELSR